MRLNIRILGETASIQTKRGGLFMVVTKSNVADCVAGLNVLDSYFPEITPLIFMSEFVSGNGSKSLIAWSKKMNPVAHERLKNQFINEIGDIDTFSTGCLIEYRLKID